MKAGNYSRYRQRCVSSISDKDNRVWGARNGGIFHQTGLHKIMALAEKI